MKKKSLATTAIMATMAMATPAKAQENAGSTPRQWTLEECISYALENNISLKQTRLSIEQNDINVSQAQGGLFPSLSFSTNHNLSWRPWSQTTVHLESGTMTTTNKDVTYNGSYGLNANWTVWDGGRKYKQVGRYKLNSEMSSYEEQETANSIQEQITQYYVQILYQTEAIKVNEQILASSLQQRDRAKEMVEAGSLARVDLAQIEAQAGQDEYNVVNAKTQLANYKLQLKQILEIIGTEEFDVVIPDIDDNDILSPLPDKEDVYEKAVATRPEIKSSQLNIEGADLDINIARRGFYPTLGLTAGVNTSHSSSSDDSFGMQAKHNLSNSVGVSLSVPILDGRSNRTSLQKAKLTRQQNELQLLNTQKELYRQVENYWLQAQAAQQQYIAAQKSQASMAESYSLVSEQFNLGLKNIVELNTGRNNLLQAEQQLLQSKYTALLNIAMLRFYSGDGIRL